MGVDCLGRQLRGRARGLGRLGGGAFSYERGTPAGPGAGTGLRSRTRARGRELCVNTPQPVSVVIAIYV